MTFGHSIIDTTLFMRSLIHAPQRREYQCSICIQLSSFSFNKICFSISLAINMSTWCITKRTCLIQMNCCFFIKIWWYNASGCVGVGRLTSALKQMDHPRHCELDLWPRLPFVVHSGFDVHLVQDYRYFTVKSHQLSSAFLDLCPEMHHALPVWFLRCSLCIVKGAIQYLKVHSLYFHCVLFIVQIVLPAHIKHSIRYLYFQLFIKWSQFIKNTTGVPS